MAAVGPSSPFQPPMLLTRAVGGGRAGLAALQEQGSLHLRRAGEDRAVSTLRLQPTHRPARCKRTALALPLGQAGGHLRLLTQHSALKALAALLSSPAKVHRATCWSREGKRSRAGSPHRFFAPLVWIKGICSPAFFSLFFSLLKTFRGFFSGVPKCFLWMGGVEYKGDMGVGKSGRPVSWQRRQEGRKEGRP